MSGLNRSTANQSKWGKGKAGPMMPDRTITGTIEAREIESSCRIMRTGDRERIQDHARGRSRAVAGSCAREIEARRMQDAGSGDHRRDRGATDAGSDDHRHDRGAGDREHGRSRRASQREDVKNYVIEIYT